MTSAGRWLNESNPRPKLVSKVGEGRAQLLCDHISMSRKLLVASLLAGVLVLVFGTNMTRPIYSFRVSQFVAQPRWNERVRVTGALVHGSLCKVDDPCEYRFSVSDRSTTIAVSYEGCIVPDTFRGLPWLDVEVTAEGERCQGCHALKASSLMAKCPAKYYVNMNGHSHEPSEPIARCTGRTPGR
jgi:cytochrome c-type biogenesis protein CcmE